MGERNVDAPNLWDRFTAEFGGNYDTGEVDYDLERLNSLGTTQWKAEELRKQALKVFPQVRKKLYEHAKATTPVDLQKDIPRLTEEQFYAMIARNLQGQGKMKGAQLWDAIARRTYKVNGRLNKEAVEKDRENMPWMQRAIWSGVDVGMTYADARFYGAIEPVAGLVAEAGKKLVGDTGLVWAGDDAEANKAFAGRQGYRKARAEISHAIEGVISTDKLGFDLDLGAATREAAGLYGFVTGADTLRKGATARLAKMGEKTAAKAGLSKAGLMAITGTTPKAAAKAFQAGRILAKGIQKGEQFIPRIAGKEARGALEKVVTGTFLGSIPKSAANFGAYEGLVAFNRAVGNAAGVAAEGGTPLQAFTTYVEGMKRVPQAWLNGATTGALFPFFQKLGEGIVRGTKGSLLQMGATSKNLLSKRFVEAFKGAPELAARARAAGLGTQAVAGMVEFGAFPLAPHWDANYEPHFQTFEDLLSDDPKKRALGMKAIMSSMIMSIFVKSRQAYKLRNGEIPDPEPGGIDYYATWRDGFRTIKRYGEKGDGGPRDKTPEEKALEDAQQQWLARSGLELPGATDNVAIDVIRMMGDAVDRLEGNPELAEALVFDLVRTISLDSKARSDILKALKQAGGRRASYEMLPSYVLGEFRRRIIDKADAARDKDDANEKLAEALDNLQDAKARLGDYADADPETQNIQQQIAQLQQVLASAEGRLNPEAKSALETELDGLTKALKESEAVGFGVYEQAKQDFIEAAYQRVLEVLKEQRKEKRDKEKEAKDASELLAPQTTAEEGADVERTARAALGLPEEDATPSGEGASKPSKPSKPKTSKPSKPSKPKGPTPEETAAAETERLKRAENEAKSNEMMSEERAKVPEKASATRIAEALRLRAASLTNASHSRWPLRAAEILEDLGDARVREILHESGAAGLRREGISDKLAKEIRDVLGVPLKKQVPPGAGGKAPGKKEKAPLVDVEEGREALTLSDLARQAMEEGVGGVPEVEGEGEPTKTNEQLLAEVNREFADKFVAEQGEGPPGFSREKRPGEWTSLVYRDKDGKPVAFLMEKNGLVGEAYSLEGNSSAVMRLLSKARGLGLRAFEGPNTGEADTPFGARLRAAISRLLAGRPEPSPERTREPAPAGFEHVTEYPFPRHVAEGEDSTEPLGVHSPRSRAEFEDFANAGDIVGVWRIEGFSLGDKEAEEGAGARGTWLYAPADSSLHLAYVELKNPLKAEDKQDAGRKLGLDADALLNESEYVEDQALRDAAAQQGYDAIVYRRATNSSTEIQMVAKREQIPWLNKRPLPEHVTKSINTATRAHAVIEGQVAKWKGGVPEKANLKQMVEWIDRAMAEADTALEELPPGTERRDMERMRTDLANRKRWFEYEQTQRDMRAKSEDEAEVPEVDDKGNSTAATETDDGRIDPRMEGANALERFRERSGNDLLEALHDFADEMGPEVRANLPLIQAGLELGREFVQDAANDRLIPMTREGGLTFGDRVVVKTGDGRVVAGIVVSEPKDMPAERTGFIGRRLKLFDGEQTHSVRIADIADVKPESIRDINTDVGLSDGVWRNGAEITPSMLLQILRPEPISFPEHVTTPADRKQRRKILRGKGTVDDQRKQAEMRQRRLRLLEGGETLHPDDWMAIAQQQLVPRDQRKFAFSAPSAGGREAKLAKALRDQAAGKALSKEQNNLLDSITRTDIDVLSWMGEYHDPATATVRTPEELEAASAKDGSGSEARKSWNLYQKYVGEAEAADKLLKDSLSSRKVRDAGAFMTLIGSKAGNVEHLLEWREYNSGAGRMGRARGKPPHVFATYRPETGTWLLRTAQRGEAIAWVRENIDAKAISMKRYAQGQRKLARALDSELVAVAVMDRQRQLSEIARNALDVLMGWAHEGTLDQRFTFARPDSTAEAAVQKSEEQKAARETLREALGDIIPKIEKWLEKNPQPEGEGDAFNLWAKRFERFLTKGSTSIYGEMLLRIDEGLHPLTGLEAVFDEGRGTWVSSKKKGGEGYTVYAGLPVLPAAHAVRDLVGLMRHPVRNTRAVYGIVHGMTADLTGSVLQTTLVMPLQKLSRAVLGLHSGPDRADTAFGWSPNATKSAMVHNRHLAKMDLIAREADDYVKDLAKKYGHKKLLELVRAEHEGKAPWQLREFRQMMQDIAQEMKDLGMVGKDFDARYDGRYVRLGRYTWKNADHLKDAMQKARQRSKELGEEIIAFRDAADAAQAGEPWTPGQKQRLRELNAEAAAQDARATSLRRQWKRAGRSLFKNWRAYNQIHNAPVDVFDVQKLRSWEGANRRRENDDWDWHVDNGLDISRPELLLWDSIIHHRQAIETYRFMKEIAEDKDLSRSIRKAPKDWVLIQPEDVRSDLAFKELAGRKVSPWIYHFIKLSEGPNGWAERISNDVHSAIKMSLTFASPANWALQVVANPLMVGVKAGTSIWRAYPEYIKALTELFLPHSRKRLEGKYGPMRFLDVATDADREFMHNLRSTNPDINTRNFMGIMAEAANNFREGKVLRGAASGVKGLVAHPANRWLQLQSFMYRTFDAAGRVATYRILRKQGKTRAEAEAAVVQGWDLFHQNKWGDFLRKGVVQVPGTKVKIPLPIMANSFGSVPVTFLRNFGQIMGKTPLQFAELAVTIALYNQGVQMANGMTDDEVERLQRNTTPNTNGVLHWLRSKTTPISPDGTQAYDLWNYHPVTAATEAVPGLSQAMWGGLEGFSDEGLKGVIPGMARGKGGYGLTAEQDFISKALGSGHVMLAPYSEYLFDRDARGAAVRWRHERPALWGSQGVLKVAVEEGHLPVAIVYALGKMAGLNDSFNAELAAMAGSITSLAAELDRTASGENTDFDIINDGEGLFEVRPKSAEDVLLRRAGFRQRHPDAMRRILERVERQKGITKDKRHGNYKVEEDVPPALRENLRRMAQFGNQLKLARSGAYLWGMARHWAETKLPGYAKHLKDYDQGEPLPENFWDGDAIRDQIKARWKSPESRARAANALVILDMGEEAGETLQILEQMKLLDPSEDGARMPPMSPDEVQSVFKAR